MALFLSTITNKMDSKCRVSVPSNFRNSLQKQSFKGLIAFPSYKHPSIDACGIDRMERISEDLDNNNQYSQEEFDLISLYFGEAEQIPFDKDGRIVVPKKVDTTCSYKKRNPIRGFGTYFSDVNPEKYKKIKQQTLKKAVGKKN